MPTVSPSRRFFARINTDGNDEIDRSEAEAYVEGLGLRGALARMAVDKLLGEVGNGARILYSDLVANGAKLLPSELQRDGVLDRSAAAAFFGRLAGRRSKAKVADVARYLEPRIDGMAALFAPRLAKALAEMTVDLLDGDGDRAFTRDDLFALLDDLG
jgi:hypothetical protein